MTMRSAPQLSASVTFPDWTNRCPVGINDQVYHPNYGRGVVMAIKKENYARAECEVGVIFNSEVRAFLPGWTLEVIQ